MYRKNDIKTGFMLVITAPDGKQYNADVHHAAAYTSNFGPTIADGELICKTSNCEQLSWFPVASLSQDLTYERKYSHEIYSVDTIYGYAPPPFARYCSTSGRRVLWQRTPPKAMTIEEISAEIGYKVALLPDGRKPPVPLYIPRSSIDDGMMVVLRNNSRCLITTGGYNQKYVLNPASPANSEPFSHYNDELRYFNSQQRELDIMEVWGAASDPAYMLTASEAGRKVKWRRDETTYMTLTQICTALGYLVTIKAG